MSSPIVAVPVCCGIPQVSTADGSKIKPNGESTGGARPASSVPAQDDGLVGPEPAWEPGAFVPGVGRDQDPTAELVKNRVGREVHEDGAAIGARGADVRDDAGGGR